MQPLIFEIYSQSSFSGSLELFYLETDWIQTVLILKSLMQLGSTRQASGVRQKVNPTWGVKQ